MEKGMHRTQRRGQIESLQALRALAFFGVFLQHLGEIQLGAWGVSVFFVMSGALMTYHYINREQKGGVSACLCFSVQKIKKLYPLHIITLALCLLYEAKELIPSFSVMRGIETLGKLIMNALLLQAWVPSSEVFFSFNGLSWYLSTSLFIYACFPMLIALLKKINLKKVIILGGCVYLIQWILGYAINATIPEYVFWFVYIFPLFRLGDFFVGCCVGKILLFLMESETKLKETKYSLIEIGIMITFVLTQTFYIVHYKESKYIWMMTTLIYTPIAASMVLVFALNKGVITKILSNQFLVSIGNISAYTYLIHQVVIRYALSISHRLTRHGLDGVILLLLTVICASAYQMVEQRIRNRL